MTTETETPTVPRMIPATRWNDFHQWPPPGGMRHLLFNRESNGFSECVVKVGKRILINEARFFEWLETQNQN